MAPIFQFKCSKCDYHVPGGLDGEFYVENAQLKRISTGEVIDEEKIMAATGMEYWDAYNAAVELRASQAVGQACLSSR